MHRCGAPTTTTERPCGARVATPGTRCPRHTGHTYATPTGNVVDLNTWRRLRNHPPAYRRAHAYTQAAR